MVSAEPLYALFSSAFSFVGLAIAGFAVHAYQQTEKVSMMYLAVGFALLTAAMVSTAISVFVTGYDSVTGVLTVHSALSVVGLVLVVYSLAVHR